MKEIIIMAKSIKEAKIIAADKYPNAVYVKPYRYASKGNNFYLFKAGTGEKVRILNTPQN